jgi:hypothetical protein
MSDEVGHDTGEAYDPNAGADDDLADVESYDDGGDAYDDSLDADAYDDGGDDTGSGE